MSSITWKETRQRIQADKQRLKTFYAQNPSGQPLVLLLNNSFLCVYLHRLSHFFFDRGNKLFARFFWHLNLLLTGADISPLSDIGGGLIVKYPLCVIIVGKLGSNCTIDGHGGIGGGRDTKDIGAGPGLPVIGDDVYLAIGSFILGPVKVGDGAYIEPKCFVTRPVPAGATVECPQPRQRIQKSAAIPEKEPEE